MGLRELVERTIAKAMIAAAMTPGGIPAEFAADLMGHLDVGGAWFDEAVERMAVRWYGPREWASFGEKQRALCRGPLRDLLRAAVGEGDT